MGNSIVNNKGQLQQGKCTAEGTKTLHFLLILAHRLVQGLLVHLRCPLKNRSTGLTIERERVLVIEGAAKGEEDLGITFVSDASDVQLR